MTFKRDKRIDNSEPLKKWILSLSGLLVIGTAFYFYCVGSIVTGVVARQEAEAQITALNSQVSVLESQYLSLKNAVTEDKALSLGFVSAADQKFVVRGGADQAAALSLAVPGL